MSGEITENRFYYILIALSVRTVLANCFLMYAGFYFLWCKMALNG